MSESFKVLLKFFSIYLLLVLSIGIFIYWSSDKSTENYEQFAIESGETLSNLVKTKYFKIIRMNINQQCPLMIMTKLCKSQGCTVCRCDQKDIPQEWKNTDKIKRINQNKMDVWEQERDKSDNQWVWHVQDQQNDQGQYFDVEKNVESYTAYNGTSIWRLIYEENCFQGANKFQQMCEEQKVLYKLISGIHTSISSHLTNLYRNLSQPLLWGDTSEAKFFVNQSEYIKRVHQHPQRFQNLIFLYKILIAAIDKVQSYLANYTISSENINDDFKATRLLQIFLESVKKYSNTSKFEEIQSNKFFSHQNPKIHDYQKYIHNISRILNCVECEKCRLFGKMQTYGVGTALKILLGYQYPYKRNQIVALFNTLNKVSISLNNYIRVKGKKDKWFDLKLWSGILGVFFLFVWLVCNINIKSKVKKNFKNTFPSHFKEN